MDKYNYYKLEDDTNFYYVKTKEKITRKKETYYIKSIWHSIRKDNLGNRSDVFDDKSMDVQPSDKIKEITEEEYYMHTSLTIL